MDYIKRNKLGLLTIGTVVLLATVIIAMGATGNKVQANLATQATYRSIKVSGVATTVNIPDTAYITINTEVTATELNKATDEHEKAIKGLTSITKESGVPEENIRTTYYNITPNYDWDESKLAKTIAGYSIVNVSEIKITDKTKVDELITKLTEDSNNTLESVKFNIASDKDLYEEALQQAILNAESKALILGKKYGITKVTPIKIDETSASGSYGNNRSATVEATDPKTQTRNDMRMTVNVNVEYGY